MTELCKTQINMLNIAKLQKKKAKQNSGHVTLKIKSEKKELTHKKTNIIHCRIELPFQHGIQKKIVPKNNRERNEIK